MLSEAHTGPIHVGSGTGSCVGKLEATTVDLDIALDPSAVPWAALLRYRTFVDDVVWDPAWSVGFYDRYPGARDVIYAECPSADGTVDEDIYDRGLSVGMHTVRIEAQLPGSELTWRSAEVAFSLPCDAPRSIAATPDAFEPEGPTEVASATWDDATDAPASGCSLVGPGRGSRRGTSHAFWLSALLCAVHRRRMRR